MKQFLVLFLAIIIFNSCSEDPIPKPKAYLRLSYPNATYQNLKTDCPYTFEITNEAIYKTNTKCWTNISYPKLKATLNITYRPVDNNLTELLKESEKLTYKHSIKADGISAMPYENSEKKVYGSILEVTGNAASPLQFHLTDSTKHFVTGSLYFEVQPNYDSILPAIKFVEKDIRHLIETFEWKN